jgi:hypothetical protein
MTSPPAKKVSTTFEVRHPCCVSQNHKIKQQTLESRNTTILYYIIYIERMMVTAKQIGPTRETALGLLITTPQT